MKSISKIQDMSAMVSALTQVIGNTDKNPLHALGNPSPISARTPRDQPSHLLQDQGTRSLSAPALDKDSVHEFDSNKLRVVSEAYKVDWRHGKRPLPSDEAEEKEDQDHIFPVYSARSQQDMSAMVSALTQVIGNTDKNPLHALGNPSPISHHSATTPHDQPSQLLQDQGNSMMARPMKKRQPWIEVEDWVLFEYKRTNMDLPWPDIAKLTGLGRSGKSCRERWKNHLDPDVKRGKFSKGEDDSIICFQSLYGNSWTSIAAHLPGRTDNDVKNRWYNHLRKKKLGKSTGDQPHIDPNASSSSIPTLVSASQEIASTWSTSELASLESEFMPTEEVIKFWSA